LSSDLFAIGGHGSVRGFDPAESTGEHGLSLSREYAHVFDSVSGWSLEAGLGGWLGGGRCRRTTETAQRFP